MKKQPIIYKRQCPICLSLLHKDKNTFIHETPSVVRFKHLPPQLCYTCQTKQSKV